MIFIKKIILSPCEIRETQVSGQHQRLNDRAVINVAAENNRLLSNTPPFICGVADLASRLYDMEVHNMAKKNFSELRTDAKTRRK